MARRVTISLILGTRSEAELRLLVPNVNKLGPVQRLRFDEQLKLLIDLGKGEVKETSDKKNVIQLKPTPAKNVAQSKSKPAPAKIVGRQEIPSLPEYMQTFGYR